MFEHLDDRDGFRPSATLLTTVTRDGRRRRRRTRVAQAGTASVAALALGAGVAVTSFNRKLDSIERVEVAALTQPDPDPAEPYTLLLTGLDHAADGPAIEGSQPPNQRTDTIALVRVLPAEEKVTFLALPRDLWVDIPGHGEGRINSAMPLGGVDLLVQTIDANFGLAVNHYAAIDFAGAQALGDAVGGLRFDFEYPVRDRSSGLSIPEPGCRTLDGTELLALARARHLETEISPGQWEMDQGWDLSRLSRQETVALAALSTFSRLDPADPAGVNRFVDAVVANVQLDETFTRESILDLFREVAGSAIVDVRIGVEEETTAGGAEVLLPVRDRSFDEAIHLFMEGELPADRAPIDPAELFPPASLQAQPQRIFPC